jgi:hypothetical protein
MTASDGALSSIRKIWVIDLNRFSQILIPQRQAFVFYWVGVSDYCIFSMNCILFDE